MTNLYQVPGAFTARFPEIKPKWAEIYYRRYLKLVRDYAIMGMLFGDGITFNFPLNHAKRQAGSFIHKGKRYYVWNEFFAVKPFFHVITTGSNLTNKTSEVKIMNERELNLLIDLEIGEQLIEEFYPDLVNTDFDELDVDIDSITAYIAETQQLLDTIQDQDSKYYKQIQKSLRDARFIRAVSTYYYNLVGLYIFPMVISPSAFGRRYYKKISIQTVHKQVRRAAVGPHHVYDLKAAAFAVKLHLVQDIFCREGVREDRSTLYTADYLERKREVRAKLVKLMPHTPDAESRVKELLAAIGFGAQRRNSAWRENNMWKRSAIRDIILNAEDRTAILNDTWLNNFWNEQKQLTDVIALYAIRNPQWLDEMLGQKNVMSRIDQLEGIKNLKGTYDNDVIVSFLYQHMETRIMDQVVAMLSTIPTARIHDAFLTRNPVPNQELLAIRQWLKSTYNIGIDHDSKQTFTYKNQQATQPVVIDELAAHRERIYREEQWSQHQFSQLPTIPSQQPSMHVRADDLIEQVEWTRIKRAYEQ